MVVSQLNMLLSSKLTYFNGNIVITQLFTFWSRYGSITYTRPKTFENILFINNKKTGDCIIIGIILVNIVSVLMKL